MHLGLIFEVHFWVIFGASPTIYKKKCLNLCIYQGENDFLCISHQFFLDNMLNVVLVMLSMFDITFYQPSITDFEILNIFPIRSCIKIMSVNGGNLGRWAVSSDIILKLIPICQNPIFKVVSEKDILVIFCRIFYC